MRALVASVLAFVAGVYFSFSYGVRVNENWVRQECAQSGRAELAYAEARIKCRVMRKDEK